METAMKTRPHSRKPPVDLVERRAFVRERERQAQEAALVSIDCRHCGEPLATAMPGSEAFCRPCQTWTPSVPSPKRGAVG